MKIRFTSFSQRGSGKAHNEDAVLLDGQVHQGSVREHGEVDMSQPHLFAIADGVSGGALPRTASRRLLELLQTRLATAPASASPSALLHQLRQDYAALSSNREFLGMASTLVGVRLVGNSATIFNAGDSRAYLLTTDETGPQARLLTRDHSVLNDMIGEGEITQEQSEDAASFMRGLTSQFIVDTELDDFKVNVVTHTLNFGERLLLCSDGLNEVLSDAEIASLLVGDSAEDLLNTCKASRRAGGTDDFSVIVLGMQT
jgi:serine/threonine protein phosphatase PrpC